MADYYGSQATVRQMDDGLEILLTGPIGANPNIELLQSCANTLLACAERCADMSEPLVFLEQTFRVFAGHNAATACFSRGFGLISGAEDVQIRSADDSFMPAENYTKITRTDDGVRLQIVGPQAAMADVALLESCTNTLLRSVEANDCLTERGLQFNDSCIQELSVHAQEANCISQGFGLLQPNRKG